MDKWKWQNSNGIRYINIPAWAEMGVDAVFTAKDGGFSENEFASLNMALHVGDNEEAVIKNRFQVLNILNTGLENMVCSEQVHGTNIAVVGEEHLGKGAYQYSSAIKETDAMVTDVPNICLTTFYADCFPIFIFDPHKRAVGIAHSGWKGTMELIGVKTVKVMQQEFGCSLDDIQVFIGPGIDRCCFEISADLGVRVKEKFADFNNILTPWKKGFLWDLPNTIRQALLNLGIRDDHIIVSQLCTSCNNEDFFSYRREKGKTGRMAAIIRLRY